MHKRNRKGWSWRQWLFYTGLIVCIVMASQGERAHAASFVNASLDSSSWTITTTLDDGNQDLRAIQSALFDNNTSTAWTSNKHQSPWGLVLQIDMQTPTEVDTIYIDSGASPDYGRQYTIQSDADWSAVLAQVNGQSGITKITIPKTRARLLNIFQTGSADAPWTVADVKLANGEAAFPGDPGLEASCIPDACTLSWTEVSGATGYQVFRSTTYDGVYNKINASALTTNHYTDAGLEAGKAYFYKITATDSSSESSLSSYVAGLTVENPFGPKVQLFDPSMSAADIQNVADSIFATQERSEFGSARHAMLFKPGTYSNVNVKVGFYTQVSGLGQNPDDVNINGTVNVDAKWNNGNALVNFWRSSENMSITPPSGSTARWAVAQAAPMRRMHINGSLDLFDFDSSWNAGYASGGYLADSIVAGVVAPASQQQWFSRNNQYNGWTNGLWNMVFVGDARPPEGVFPDAAYTVVEKTPLVREKPYLYIDGAGHYQVFVPDLGTNTQGASWQAGSTPGHSVPLTEFYIADPSTATAASINAALSEGKNLLFTPGNYHLNDTIRVTKPNTIVMGLGFATLIPDNGRKAMTVEDVDGVIIASLLFDAGSMDIPALLEIGNAGSTNDHSTNPISLHDLFFRVGGAHPGSVAADLVIHSKGVIGDHFWIWRADHGTGAGGWQTNDSTNGLIVNGDDVTLYGLFNEHHNEYQTLWNGNGGRLYFYQSEIPYEVPDQATWMSKGGTVNGYASYKVADSVTRHEAWGLGVYSYFRDASVKLNSAIEVPDADGVKIHHATSIFLAGNGEITHVVNGKGATANQANYRQTVTEYPAVGGVTGVTVSQTSWSAKERESIVLAATIMPEQAADQTVSWSSSNPFIAAVDGAGRVTALHAGTAIITVTTRDGNWTAQTSVQVTAKEPFPIVSGKKGISAIKYLSTEPSKLSDLNLAWAYNWSVDYAGSVAGLEYVPMLWGPGAVSDDAISKLKTGKNSGRFSSLLGYNEPELVVQSNTSVADTIKLWPRLMETGLRLGSPAVAYTYDDSYAAGKSWLSEFMTQMNAKHYPVDFIAVHFYPDFTDPDAVTKLKNTLTSIHNQYGKPIWITEIGAIPFGTTHQTPTQALATTFMKRLLPVLDGLDFVERYAWFGDNCSHDQGCAYTTLYDASDSLTPMGILYQDPSAGPELEPADPKLPRTGWHATASSTAFGSLPEFTLDGDWGRQWSTTAGQVGGEWFQLDMGQVYLTSGVEMDAGANATFDYARGFTVELSVDGQAWTYAASGNGLSQQIKATWERQSARYVRITQTGYDGFWRWTINELDIQGVAIQSGLLPSASLVGPTSVYRGQEFEVTIGVHNLPTRFTTLQTVLAYDPATIQFNTLTNTDGSLSLAQNSIIPSPAHFLVLGTAVKADAGQILIIMASNSANETMDPSSDVMRIRLQAKVGAAAGITVLSVTYMTVANEGISSHVPGSSTQLTIVHTDKTELITQIQTVQGIHDTAVEGTLPGQHVAGSKANLQSVIDSAKAVRDNPASTTEQVTDAVNALLAATDVFRNAVNPETPVQTEKTALHTAITAAQSKLSKAVTGTKLGQYPASAISALQQVIQASLQSESNAYISQGQVDQATAQLNVALQVFAGQIITLVSGQTQITLNDLSLLSKYYGIRSSDAGWSTVQSADLFDDGEIDIRVLAAVARMILNDWLSQ